MTDTSRSVDPAVRRYRPGKVVRLEDLVHDQAAQPETPPQEQASQVVEEIGGRREGLEPTRYGDWEKKGRCIDF